MRNSEDTEDDADQIRAVIHYLKINYPKYDMDRFERIIWKPGRTARKLTRLYLQKYRAVFDERYEVAAELKIKIERLEHALFQES